LKEVIARSSLEPQIASEAVNELIENGSIVVLSGQGTGLKISDYSLVASEAYWSNLSRRALQERKLPSDLSSQARHVSEELKSRLKIPPFQFNDTLNKLVGEGEIGEKGPLVFLPVHKVRFSPEQERAIHTLLERFAASPYSPPPIKDVQAEVGEDLFNALVDLDYLMPVSSDVVFRRVDYDRMLADVQRLFEQHGTLTAGQVRDHFKTSRRYALALLEHLDAVGITIRDGDVRRLRANR
jgi:selenocysteine-specific elongation factor